MTPKSRQTTEAALREATGHGWTHWFTVLDRLKDGKATHKEAARHVQGLGTSAWWSQTITVEWERERGKRVVGQTGDGSFQVGVTRTLPISPAAAWRRFGTTSGLRALLGGAPARVAKGATFSCDHGQGEVRSYDAGTMVRISMDDGKRKRVVQIRVEEAATGTKVLIHSEGLASAKEREAWRARWKAALS